MSDTPAERERLDAAVLSDCLRTVSEGDAMRLSAGSVIRREIKKRDDELSALRGEVERLRELVRHPKVKCVCDCDVCMDCETFDEQYYGKSAALSGDGKEG